ncbi:hypothetical protein ACLOAU_05515 [Niabella sp. CJ426]|uniref:hypothetical protein n=1 Tax=Niabella sp. CJ426 TaxID=3393740 RepID=UPI003D02C07A
MDKKLINISNVSKKAEEFSVYLSSCVHPDVWFFLKRASAFSEILIFSGVIRNFFLKDAGKIRDLDIVFNCDEKYLKFLLKGIDYKRNSFGGYKLLIGNLNIDFWHIDNTWAFQNKKVDNLLFKDQTLANTSFFNFASVVYNLSKKEFIFSNSFLSFLNDRTLDIVLRDNPLPELCIVNTVYYKTQFNLEVSDRLKKYFVEYFIRYTEEEYNMIQLKHFNKCVFSYEYLKTYCKIFENDLHTQNTLEATEQIKNKCQF